MGILNSSDHFLVPTGRRQIFNFFVISGSALSGMGTMP